MHQRPQTAQRLPEAMTIALPTPAGPSVQAAAAEAGAMAMDPTERPDWDSLLGAHPQSTVFHGSAWARVLRDTYGHRPFYIARFDGGRLSGLLPLMEASSWLTGRRGISLPFSDSCSVLETGGDQGRELFRRAMDCGRQRGWKYLECRGDVSSWEGAAPSVSFYSHAIDLSIGEEKLFNGLESAVRRGVRKAGQAGVRISFDTGMESVRTFFALHCRTRRRHGLPAQPFRFFRNIQRHLLAPGQGFIATARLGNQPLASSVFFCHGRQALYKFGASDYRFQQLRPNNLVMWEAMRHGAQRGLATLNLGRTSLSNQGLRRFKLGLGAVEEEIRYARYVFSTRQFVQTPDRAEGWFNGLFAAMPLPLLRLSGAILYPHLS
jgi:CelD/BcsL family acetyltransferase involved in cellulose biosynthesis